MTVPEIILQQMGGGGRLKAMLGTKHLIGDNNALIFDFKMCKKAKRVRIELNAMDTYDITFYKVRKFEHTNVKEYNGVYCDQLKAIFEHFTGLYLTF